MEHSSFIEIYWSLGSLDHSNNLGLLNILNLLWFSNYSQHTVAELSAQRWAQDIEIEEVTDLINLVHSMPIVTVAMFSFVL